MIFSENRYPLFRIMLRRWRYEPHFLRFALDISMRRLTTSPIEMTPTMRVLDHRQVAEAAARHARHDLVDRVSPEQVFTLLVMIERTSR
jgi:hypothetical protein